MYAVYNYKAGSTQAQVLADLIAILTGTTNVPSLSASCVQANTSILATVPAGWTLHDAAAGVNAQVIRALNQDGTTTKYLGLCASSTTTFVVNAFESWNAGTHAGTNGVPSNTVTSNGGCAFTWDAAGGGFFYIYASQKNFVLMSWTTLGYQAMAGHTIELTRESIPAGYPCHAILMAFSQVANSNATSFKLPRVKTANAAGDQTTPGNLLFTSGAVGLTPIGSINSLALGQTYRDAADAVQIALYKWGVQGINAALGPQLQGVAYDVLLTGATGITNLDELTISGTTYVMFKGSDTNACLAVPKA